MLESFASDENTCDMYRKRVLHKALKKPGHVVKPQVEELEFRQVVKGRKIGQKGMISNLLRETDIDIER